MGDMLTWEIAKLVASLDGHEYVIEEEEGDWAVIIDGTPYEVGITIEEAKMYCENTAAEWEEEASEE